GEDYYIKMMVAWYFATALAKRYDESVVFIEERRLDSWTHKKAIQKAIESYRVTDEHKEYLKTLR
ncbi:MAG: DNA alkylation repair protein, partial [Oscillospiraceae bacterium]|nr:DNA alkylation repair protein [Oscillospiraceae bacterium]